MNKVFVLGWTGYVGTELVSRLKNLGIQPMLVGRASGSDLHFDLTQPDLNSLSKFGYGDKFVFLSAVSSPDFCAKNYDEAYKVNVSNTAILIDALLDRGVEVLFASSDVVYGRTELPVTEEDELNPQFAYAEMKAEVEDMFKGQEKFKAMRLSYVWSLRDKFTRFLLQSYADRSVIEVFHPFIRSIVSLDDVIDFIVNFVFSSDEFPALVNLAGPEFLSRVQMVETFAKYRPIEYIVTYPEEEFFLYRPDQILMQSIYLDEVLGRGPFDILDAMKIKLS